MDDTYVIWWCRRDIRIADNAALYHALKSGFAVQPIFVFDKNILDDLREYNSIYTLDRRVEFIYNELVKLNIELAKYNSSIQVYYGEPKDAWKKIVSQNQKNIKGVYVNRDYEPYAIQRDKSVTTLLEGQQIPFLSFKDQCIFEFDEVVKDDNTPYTVFTPYSRKWKSLLTPNHFESYPNIENVGQFRKQATTSDLITLEEMGFSSSNTSFPPKGIDQFLLDQYATTRDIPSLPGTSRLGVHLRFGTISIRKVVQSALQAKSAIFLNELIWRDFYMMILSHFPHVVNRSFRSNYDNIPWRNDEEAFKRWCAGNTGYPIVDAGMRELNATGYMHNRVRMITASFLTKHLLIDWRWGEAYFAKKLLDYELASNNGGWQWAAGTGCDAAPYFRVFNPYLQTQKFDPELKYIKKWIPELDTPDYPTPIVEHSFARNRAIEVYRKALKP